MQDDGIEQVVQVVVRLVCQVVAANAAVWNIRRGNRVLDIIAQIRTEEWKEALRRPFARVVELSCHKTRRADPVLRAAYLYELIILQPDWPDNPSPCEACSMPTGCWCEGCDCTERVICSRCEDDVITCRGCPNTAVDKIHSKHDRVFYGRAAPGAEVPAWQQGSATWADGVFPDMDANDGNGSTAAEQRR